MTVRSTLSIEVYVECPYCEEAFDLMTHDNLNEEGKVIQQAIPRNYKPGASGSNAPVMSDVDYNQGVVYAVARIIELHDEPTVALDVLKEAGISKDELSQCCEYDLAFIRQHDDSIPCGVE